MHSSRALEKLYVDKCGGEPPKDYMQQYMRALEATADPEDVIWEDSGEEQE